MVIPSWVSSANAPDVYSENFSKVTFQFIQKFCSENLQNFVLETLHEFLLKIFGSFWESSRRSLLHSLRKVIRVKNHPEVLFRFFFFWNYLGFFFFIYCITPKGEEGGLALCYVSCKIIEFHIQWSWGLELSNFALRNIWMNPYGNYLFLFLGIHQKFFVRGSFK